MDKDGFHSQFDDMRKKIEDALRAALPVEDTTGEPCRALLLSGGKRWRPLLLVLCANVHKRATDILTEDDIYRLCPVVEFAHTASLIHDDIEDGSATRRGRPCAHITYGLDTAVNAASYLYFLAAKCIDTAPFADDVKCHLYAMYMDVLRKAHEGQALDIAWHKKSGFFPAVAEYTRMTSLKTGAIASLAARVGAAAGGCAKEEEERLGNAAVTLGVGFQALDDARNIEEGNPGKDKGDDIVEGKKSLPVLLHLAEHPADKERIQKLFKQAAEEGVQSSAVKECVDMLNKSGAARAAREHGRQLVEQARKEMATSELSAFIDELLGEM